MFFLKKSINFYKGLPDSAFTNKPFWGSKMPTSVGKYLSCGELAPQKAMSGHWLLVAHALEH